MSSEQEIRQLLSRYFDSLNGSDAERAVSCYAHDGIFMPTGAPTARGTDDLHRTYTTIFNTIRLAVAFEVDELVVASSESAYALTRSHGTQTTLADGSEGVEENREIFVFVPEAGWKISRYMFNKPR